MRSRSAVRELHHQAAVKWARFRHKARPNRHPAPLESAELRHFPHSPPVRCGNTTVSRHDLHGSRFSRERLNPAVAGKDRGRQRRGGSNRIIPRTGERRHRRTAATLLREPNHPQTSTPWLTRSFVSYMAETNSLEIATFGTTILSNIAELELVQ